MTWSSTTPVSGTKMLQTPNIYQNNWEAMEDITSQEHYAMSHSLSGRHKPGYVGAMNVSANAKIAGLSPQSGALAWLTDSGSAFGVVADAALAWKQINYFLPTTRVDAYGPTALLAVTSGSYAFHMSGGTEVLDTLGEWDNTNGIFSACGKGYFVFNLVATLSAGSTGGVAVVLGLSGTGISASRAYTTASGGLESFTFTSLVCAGSGIKIAPYAYCGAQNMGITGGSRISHFQVYRIS